MIIAKETENDNGISTFSEQNKCNIIIIVSLMVKKNKIIATFFSSHVNEHLLLVTNVSSIACSKNSFPFQPHTLISQTCKFVSITRTVYLSFTTYTVFLVWSFLVWSFCICDKINEGIHCDPQLYICSE